MEQHNNEEWKETKDGVVKERRDKPRSSSFDPRGEVTYVRPIMACVRPRFAQHDEGFAWKPVGARTTHPIAREANFPRCEEGIPSDRRILPCVRQSILLDAHLAKASPKLLDFGLDASKEPSVAHARCIENCKPKRVRVSFVSQDHFRSDEPANRISSWTTQDPHGHRACDGPLRWQERSPYPLRPRDPVSLARGTTRRGYDFTASLGATRFGT